MLYLFAVKMYKMDEVKTVELEYSIILATVRVVVSSNRRLRVPKLVWFVGGMLVVAGDRFAHHLAGARRTSGSVTATEPVIVTSVVEVLAGHVVTVVIVRYVRPPVEPRRFEILGSAHLNGRNGRHDNQHQLHITNQPFNSFTFILIN